MPIGDLKGKTGRAFVIGNAPSLLDFDLGRLSVETTFACNGFYRLYDRIAWRPTYYGTADVRFVREHWEAPRETRESAWLIPNLPLIEKPFLSFWKRHFQTHPGIYHYSYALGSEELVGFATDIDHALAAGGSASFQQLQLAVLMGHNPVYLVGIDLDYSGQPRFYGEEKEQPVWLKGEKARRTALCFKLFTEWAKKKMGTDVINLSRGGILDLPRGKWEDVFPAWNPEGGRVAGLMCIHNELSRGNLAAVDSLLGCAEKVYVYDDGSTDGTAEVLSRHPGVHLVRGEGNDYVNEIAHKSLLLDRVWEDGFDWTFWLDADERVSSELARRVPSLVRGRSKPVSLQNAMLWRSEDWIRTDSCFLVSYGFVRLWPRGCRYSVRQIESGELWKSQWPDELGPARDPKGHTLHLPCRSDAEIVLKFQEAVRRAEMSADLGQKVIFSEMRYVDETRLALEPVGETATRPRSGKLMPDDDLDVSRYVDILKARGADPWAHRKHPVEKLVENAA